MMKRMILIVGVLSFTAGCARVLTFQTPAEFRGKKSVEDPPLGHAPGSDAKVPDAAAGSQP